jgi:hypothetical protein
LSGKGGNVQGHTAFLCITYGKWNQSDVYWNGFMAPNAALTGAGVRWPVRMEDLLNKLPPFPASDGAARDGFIPVNRKLTPPPRLPAQSAVVEFGYVEIEGAGNYYRASRQETCVAAAAALSQSAPFHFEQTPPGQVIETGQEHMMLTQ